MIPKLLVVVQFVSLIFIVIISDSSITSNPISLIIFSLAILIGLIPILQKNFKVNIFPEVTKNMDLVTSGIYKFIRHPMYLSVLLVGISFVIADPKPLILLVWMILLINLHLKMDIEEINLIKTFPEYKEYRNSTKRLIPFIY
ncbi:isoprenylcysteine carboxylmethyltransferase family protein [Candidatus Dojkabacteria bacterium]|uniref:Isoprenylcysteine carboxylmethyltransferase family protein n=1 Tax=Candidatus Dojkabacteria bacterium TaxID=2099670 RepID=A0A955IBI1_9BACT|nr:isoprenylcysteine carboxylmethyltransferase family protein [Candidatus Dojkabacteria bacterium]